MGRTAIWVLTLTALVTGGFEEAAAQPPGGRPAASDTVRIPRVRSEETPLAAFIARAAEGSPAFRHLVDEVDETDGIVYVNPGECRHGGAACLALGVTIAGPNRILRTVVNPRYAACDVNLMASIGHELRHALEILRVPSLTSGIRVFHFYAREGRHSNQAELMSGGWETRAALETGFQVLKEMRSAGTERGRPCKSVVP
jgi:hypothetical protein